MERRAGRAALCDGPRGVACLLPCPELHTAGSGFLIWRGSGAPKCQTEMCRSLASLDFHSFFEQSHSFSQCLLNTYRVPGLGPAQEHLGLPGRQAGGRPPPQTVLLSQRPERGGGTSLFLQWSGGEIRGETGSESMVETRVCGGLLDPWTLPQGR